VDHKTIRIAIIMGLIAGILGCATTGPRYGDNEVEVAMRQQEGETLARLTHSNSGDISEAATALARKR